MFSVKVVGGGVFGRVLGYAGGVFRNGIYVVMRRDTSFFFFVM